MTPAVNIIEALSDEKEKTSKQRRLDDVSREYELRKLTGEAPAFWFATPFRKRLLLSQSLLSKGEEKRAKRSTKK